MRVKSYDHFNFSRFCDVQFRAYRYIISQNRTSVLKVMTSWICQELPLFNFDLLDILCARIGHPCEKLWPLEFLEGNHCSISSISIYYVPESDIWVISYDHLNFSRGSVSQFRTSRYIMLFYRTSKWKVMTIGISQGHLLFNFERLDVLCSRIVHSSEKLWPFEFLEWFCCSISRIWIYYAPESYTHVKSYDY